MHHLARVVDMMLHYTMQQAIDALGVRFKHELQLAIRHVFDVRRQSVRSGEKLRYVRRPVTGCGKVLGDGDVTDLTGGNAFERNLRPGRRMQHQAMDVKGYWDCRRGGRRYRHAMGL